MRYPPRTRAVPAALAPVLLLLVAQAATAATPRAGHRYDGKTATGQRIFLSVRDDGSGLARYVFQVRTRCSDGRRRVQSISERGEGPAGVDQEGRFDYSSPWHRSSYRLRSGRLARGRAKLSFAGRFGSPDSARGTVEARFRSPRLRCRSRGPVSFRVFRDGTENAPYRNANVATGRYALRARRRLSRMTMRTFLPWPELRRFEFRWRAPCSRGGPLSATTVLRLPLRGGRFRWSGRKRLRVRGGYVAVGRLAVRGRFFRRGNYRVKGTLRRNAVVMRRGRRVDTCRTGRLRYFGTFQGGPPNEEPSPSPAPSPAPPPEPPEDQQPPPDDDPGLPLPPLSGSSSTAPRYVPPGG